MSRRWPVEVAVEAKVEVKVVRLGERLSKVAKPPGAWATVVLWEDDER